MPDDTGVNRVRLSRRTLLAYGCPGLPLAALGLPLYVYLPGFYAEQLGLGLSAVGAVLLIARLFDVISDPIVGAISDRYHIRQTRRKGLMVLGVPVLMLGVEFLFRPAAPVRAWYLFLWSMVSYLGWTLIALPYSAWGAELSTDYHERARITISREGFVIIGTLGAAATPALFGKQTAVEQTLDLLATALWILIPLTLLITVRWVPERSVDTPSVRWLQGIRLMRENAPFLRLIAAYVLNGISSGLPATLFILFVSNVLMASQWTGPLLVLYFAAGVLSLPVWLRLARIWGKHRTWATSMLWACSVFVWVPFLGQGDIVLFAIICVQSRRRPRTAGLHSGGCYRPRHGKWRWSKSRNIFWIVGHGHQIGPRPGCGHRLPITGLGKFQSRSRKYFERAADTGFPLRRASGASQIGRGLTGMELPSGQKRTLSHPTPYGTLKAFNTVKH